MPNEQPDAQQGGLRHSLRFRILAISLTPALVGVVGLAVFFANHSLTQAESALHEHGRDVALNLATAAEYDYFVGNLPEVKRLLDYAKTRHDVLALGVSDPSGQWQVVSGRATLLPAIHKADAPYESAQDDILLFVHPIGIPALSEEDPYLARISSAHTGGMLAVAVDKRPLREVRQRTLLWAGGLLAFFLPLVGLIAWRMSVSLSTKLHELTGAVERIAGGELQLRVAQANRGELGVLERGINHMAQSMEQSHCDLEQRIADATVELIARRQAAEAAVLAKSRFLAAASHDLRQPLHALTLLVAALREQVAKGEVARLAQHIEASALAMQSLLNSLLDLSRLEAGVVQVRPECFAVDALFDRLEQHFFPIARDKKLRLRLHRTHMTAQTDPLLLERILANLLANAIRYTDRGTVLVGARRDGVRGLRIEVWDTGRGIPVDYQARVFEEYFQLDNPERDRNKGLGLGLAIVDRLARLLDCPVSIRSQPGRGSCFSVTVPRGVALPEAKRDELAKPASAQSALEGAMVALIDDDVPILEATATLLEMWGMDMAAGTNAEEIRQDLVTLGRRPDVILSDYRLSDGRNGIEAIEALRLAFGADIPAALITGDTAPETIQIIGRSGLPVMHKPLRPAKLRALLAHLLAGRKSGAPPGQPP